MRYVIFAPSIVSAVDNPVAVTLRHVVTDLMDRGHEVVVWEERLNPTMRRALELDGAAALRDFHFQFPRIDHRTYDLPPRHELAVWLSFRIAIADCVIALKGIPESLEQMFVVFDATPTVLLVQGDQQGDEVVLLTVSEGGIPFSADALELLLANVH